jgi:hypothetical protein
VIYDMEWAFILWGFFPGAPEELVSYRQPVFAGADHDYGRQRSIADMVTQQAVQLSPADLQGGLAANWRKWTSSGSKTLS